MNVAQVFNGVPSVERVRQFEALLRTFPEVDLGTEMSAHGGVVWRSIFIPAGSALTGCQTKLDNVSVVFGDITVTTDEGPKRVTGFAVIPAKAGFKRAGIAHADTWWVTLHRSDKTTCEEIEAEMVVDPTELQTHRLGYKALELS